MTSETILQSFLATHYRKLQGLRLAPFWGIFVAEPWMPHRPPLLSFAIAGCVVILLCIFFYKAIGSYYENKYGILTTTTTFNRSYAVASAAVILPIFICNLIAGTGIPAGFGVMFMPGYVIGEGFTANNLPFRKAYYILIGLLMAVCAIPAFVPMIFGHRFFAKYLLVVIGAPMLILSIIDHFTLRKSFRQISVK